MLLLLCVGGCGQERGARLTASCVHGGVQVCRCVNFMLLVVMLRMFPHVHKSKKWCRVTCQHIRGAYGAHFLSFLEWSDFANPPAKSQGTTLKVGIRNNLHCLAFKLDIHLRFMIVHAFKNGTELLAAIDGSFGLDAVMGAIKTYSRKNESVEALLLAEYEAFTAKTGVWSLKWKSAEMLVKTKLPKELAKISEETKENSVTCLIELLKCKDILLARTMFKGMSEDPSVPHERKLYCIMGTGKHR